MDLASMTRDDLIAYILATRAKLEAALERNGVLEARVAALVQSGLTPASVVAHAQGLPPGVMVMSVPSPRPHFPIRDNDELRDND